jgi:hypothetical protein
MISLIGMVLGCGTSITACGAEAPETPQTGAAAQPGSVEFESLENELLVEPGGPGKGTCKHVCDRACIQSCKAMGGSAGECAGDCCDDSCG